MRGARQARLERPARRQLHRDARRAGQHRPYARDPDRRQVRDRQDRVQRDERPGRPTTAARSRCATSPSAPASSTPGRARTSRRTARFRAASSPTCGFRSPARTLNLGGTVSLRSGTRCNALCNTPGKRPGNASCSYAVRAPCRSRASSGCCKPEESRSRHALAPAEYRYFVDTAPSSRRPSAACSNGCSTTALHCRRRPRRALPWCRASARSRPGPRRRPTSPATAGSRPSGASSAACCSTSIHRTPGFPAALHDRMTQTVLRSLDEAEKLFERVPPRPLQP